MPALEREAPDRFRIRFAELTGGGLLRGLRRGDVHVDPFLIGRAVAEVMKACAFRAATGKRLLWNEYRVILARSDFELLRGLELTIERDLKQALARDAEAQDAELVGDLRVTIVFDDADELPAGEAVVRAAFVPNEQLQAPRAGPRRSRASRPPPPPRASSTPRSTTARGSRGATRAARRRRRSRPTTARADARPRALRSRGAARRRRSIRCARPAAPPGARPRG